MNQLTSDGEILIHIFVEGVLAQGLARRFFGDTELDGNLEQLVSVVDITAGQKTTSR